MNNKSWWWQIVNLKTSMMILSHLLLLSPIFISILCSNLKVSSKITVTGPINKWSILIKAYLALPFTQRVVGVLQILYSPNGSCTNVHHTWWLECLDDSPETFIYVMRRKEIVPLDQLFNGDRANIILLATLSG